MLLEEPCKDKKLIEGVYIAHRDGGFLCGKNDSTAPFVMTFSDELNCLIGGRGTGKSTVVNLSGCLNSFVGIARFLCSTMTTEQSTWLKCVRL